MNAEVRVDQLKKRRLDIRCLSTLHEIPDDLNRFDAHASLQVGIHGRSRRILGGSMPRQLRREICPLEELPRLESP